MRALKRLNAWINDAALRDVDSRLYITEITEPEADVTLEWGAAPGIAGQRLLRRTRQSKRVRIEFDIRELFDLRARAAILSAVNGWAADGILKVSYRPEQRMRVALTQAAALSDARDVSGKYAVEFTAGPSPYWEDEAATTLALTAGTTGSGTILVPGQAKTPAEITVTPSGATLNDLSVTIQGQNMTFADLAVGSGVALKIGHDERGILTIRAGDTGKLSKRTAASVDDFNLAPGSAEVSFEANAACAVSVGVRGRYL